MESKAETVDETGMFTHQESCMASVCVVCMAACNMSCHAVNPMKYG